MIALRWCRPIAVTPTEKALLWALADQADDGGKAWPSIAGLVEATCLSERSVQNAIKGLRLRHLLTTEPGGGRYRTTTYRLHLGAPETPQEVPGKAHDVRGLPEDKTPQVVQETPQVVHPNPQNPQNPQGTLTLNEPELPRGDAFSDWWESYPKKVGKDDAARAYDRAKKRGATDGELAAGLARQRWPSERRYIPNPTTWLNGGRWKDDPDAAAPPERLRSGRVNRLDALAAELLAERGASTSTGGTVRIIDGQAEEIWQ
ncbi:helix-turn-helix domain-containing protein [Roseomonas terrae]|uniref:Helix-turn-helix domain-containing protein n=1 Tax=Neoroseomonas terrae TaxID=424799 RepID=A0ABS5ELZ3_9PROT|nr:helix-turn-helix domain-containing protein [Neoroseomonas terrae]MBR0651995.1 helix-turn-helix domain-containing protein [Neoroseomonas terrae]